MNELFEFRGAIRAGLLVWMMELIGGCSGALPQPQPFVRDEANRLNERGLEAARRGYKSVAVTAFGDAYQRYAAVEYFPGMVTALINSARVNMGQDDLAAVQKALKEARTLVKFTPSLAAEVSFENAKLLLRQGKAAEALVWSQQALSMADQAAHGRMINLVAEIRFRLGEYEQADALASNSLTLAMAGSDRPEQANALRLLAECALARGKQTTAESRFNEALAIDKELALSARIATDLRGLARTAEQAGQREHAMGYWKRAANVSLTGTDQTNAVASLERLALLHEQAGDAASAARVRARIGEVIKIGRGNVER